MKLRELLSQMVNISTEIDVAKPFICGGTPRDRYLGKLENIADVDITNGEKTINYLSQQFAEELKKQYNVTYRTSDDGHSTFFIGNLKMDFSSNFNVPNIEKILGGMGINNPTSMQKEMFSRDFTCNALLLDFNFKDVIDPTKRGFKDMNEKKIKTCLSPEITLTSNRNRVARSIYLACKLGFDIDDSIIDYVSKNPQSVKIATDKALSDKLNEAFDRDGDRASYYLTKMNLWKYVPILEVMQPYYKNQSIKKAYFQGGGGVNEPTPKKKKYKSDKAIVVQPRFKEPFYHNYDIYDVPGVDGKTNKLGPGAGLYQNMEKYKSVDDFLNKKRKHMKDKYKAEDSWIEDTEENKKERIKKMKTRANVLSKLIKIAIDFPIDDQVTPIIGDTESYYKPTMLGPGIEDKYTYPNQTNLGDYETYSTPLGISGLGDKYLPQNDFENKSFDELDFGRDYTDEDEDIPENVSKLIEKYLNPGEPPLYGLPDGIFPQEDLDAPSDENPQYGETNSGNTIYNKVWF